jgi:hypothetical protein
MDLTQVILFCTKTESTYNQFIDVNQRGLSRMMDNLRRLYNAIDQRLDRKIILEERRLALDGGGSREPLTARQALQNLLPAVHAFDRGARLKSIVSPPGLSGDGLSPRWEFFFDLPGRRARLNADCFLPWDAAADNYKPASIHLTVAPFPPADSYLRRRVNEGQLLHQQLTGLWKQEMQNTVYLPFSFRDTPAVAAEFSRQGLDFLELEFSLSTGPSPDGRLSWIAQARRRSYYAEFANA